MEGIVVAWKAGVAGEALNAAQARAAKWWLWEGDGAAFARGGWVSGVFSDAVHFYE